MITTPSTTRIARWSNGIELTIVNKTTVEGFQDLGTVYPSKGSAAILESKQKALAPDGNIGPVLRFHHTSSGVEYYAAPKIKAFWCEDFA